MNFRPAGKGDAAADEFALAPLLDMLNHSHAVSISAAFNEKSEQQVVVMQNRLMIDCRTQCFEIHNGDVEYATGQQVFISYGSHNSLALVMEFVAGMCKCELFRLMPLQIRHVFAE